MAQLRKPGSGGHFFKAPNGMFMGEFKGISDGPVFERTDEKTGAKSPNPQLRWHFALTDLNGNPVLDPEAEDAQGNKIPGGAQAVAEGLTSEATGVGRNGVKAKARQWLEVMCPLSPTQPGNFDETAEPGDEVARCYGAKVLLMFGNDTTGKPGKLLQVNSPIK
jgi:hypothetical protein